jgi:hypothetical protein
MAMKTSRFWSGKIRGSYSSAGVLIASPRLTGSANVPFDTAARYKSVAPLPPSRLDPK